ncbi:hypothetical protein Bca52824_055965 [Brassica carinata]|uniref:Uncharacterized protein n=1 Tax=Brassica carinata TaxID=52824 RepID=A0A8X7ULX4_BRACI|nr:hypothetical protein Bca52824_055965 [Brassica carinata]
MPYDLYREGADFVCGYPFSLKTGVPCGVSCGFWFNLSDLDAPMQALKTEQRNTSYVDAVTTVPLKAMLPISGINIGFNRELVGPALVPALRIAEEGRKLPESAVTVEDCVVEVAKAVRDQLGSDDPTFTQASDAMVKWVQLWSEVNSSG